AQGGLVTRLQVDTSTDLTKQHSLAPTTLRGIQVGTKLLLRMVKNGVTTDSPVLTVQAIDRGTGLVTVNPVISTTVVFESRYTTVFTDLDALNADGTTTALAAPTDPRPNTFGVTARDPGSWGRDVVVRVVHQSGSRADMDTFVSGGVDD